jgi:trehalose synthase
MERMESVETRGRRIGDYRAVAGPDVVDRLLDDVTDLRGLRVLHLNSTRNGGGVSEILRSLVPLLCDLGIECEWRVIGGDPAFFEVTKRMHNALQGDGVRLTDEDQATWREWQERNADQLDGGYDVVVVHDPQPLGLAAALGSADATRWIWRLHIDSSALEPSTWAFLRPFTDPYDALVFSMPQFAPPDLPADRIRVIAPGIDPLLPKNAPIALGAAQKAVAGLGIDLARPLLAQIARLDPWKDPVGVIDAFRMVRRSHPGLQLALLGAMEAADDPEAARMADDVHAAAKGDPDIHVLTDPDVIGPKEVGAVQLLAAVVLQKSVREGFGLTVSEALWKSSPVIGGRAGGIVLQIQDGATGFLVDSPEQAAERSAQLLSDPAAGRAMGAAGRAFVRERYLITRLLADEVALYREVSGAPQPASSARVGVPA